MNVIKLAETLENIIQVEPAVHVTTPLIQSQSTSSDYEVHDTQVLHHVSKPSDQTCQMQGKTTKSNFNNNMTIF